ncbi:testis-specific Y-encoded-like protein 1 [Eulemur rufifrons]|uniref:testis-specific Y-encoded-like protein 1 n=1 Tax=Eulemur rufifrons TaxID=859984 RepID=UPI003742ACF0
MSGLGGAEKPPLSQTRSLTVSDHAPGDPDPHQCLSLHDETEATQVMAEAGEGSLETVALPPPQLLGEGGVPRDPADSGHTPQIPVGGGHGRVALGAGQEQAPPPTKGPKAASMLVAAESGMKNGFQDGGKAPKTCGAKRLWSEVMVGAKEEDVRSEKCATLSVAMDDEERAEVVEIGVKENEVVEDPVEVEEKAVDEEIEVVEENPVGEEIEVAEENPVGEEIEVAEENPVGEEIEVVEENRVVEEVQEEAAPRRLDVARPMQFLQALQREMDIVNAEGERALQQLRDRFGQRRRHYLEQRNRIIQNIPGFWRTALRSHPQLSPMFTGQDAEILRYLTNLEVKELRRPRNGCKFKFFFQGNPYFRNNLIVKEYEVRFPGRVVCVSTPIIWRRGHEPQFFIGRNQDLVHSFFTWFSDHSLPEFDRVAEIIKEDLWQMPLQYYLLGEGIPRPRRGPIREPVAIPRPFGFQSG